MKPVIVYVMGPTCAGKSVLIEAAKHLWRESLGLVEVGKAFRAKYPPSYFAGQANPDHTREEAMVMYNEFLDAELAKPDKLLIMVDGQPRQSQVTPIIGSHIGYRKLFIHLDASVDVRRGRVSARFPQKPGEGISEGAQLAISRIDNDRLTYYDVIIDLLKNKRIIKVIDTDRPESQWVGEAINYLSNEILFW